ncbi:MAG: 4Fe-4S binding protein [Anaerolineae bacterium]
MIDRIARKVVQVGFLALFLFPYAPLIYRRLTYRPASVVGSWLLAWDPLLLLAQLPRLGQVGILIGAPLLLIALTLVFGRFFCGWVCPLGTVLDIVHGIMPWNWGRKASRWFAKRNWLTLANGNSYLKYILLLASVVLALTSLKLVGLFDPLVIFHRTATVAMNNHFALIKPGYEVYLSASFLFLAILLPELIKPRFWCRHLCPLGALLGLLSRWSVLNRWVSSECHYCGKCQQVCPMNAIPREPHDTDHMECHLCLRCESACPRHGVIFRFGPLARTNWQAGKSYKTADPNARREFFGAYMRSDKPLSERILGIKVNRRGVLGSLAIAGSSLVVWPLLGILPAKPVIRPPGALPEEEFLATCILCQECIRVCPTQGLKPALLESGLRSIGTPMLLGREGGCQLNRSCPNLCAWVCPVGAIQVIPREKMRLGLAVVNQRACLAWDQGVRCLICVEACPTQAAAAYHGRVTVDPTKCSGCGICERACPVVGSAIRVTPTGEVRFKRG